MQTSPPLAGPYIAMSRTDDGARHLHTPDGATTWHDDDRKRVHVCHALPRRTACSGSGAWQPIVAVRVRTEGGRWPTSRPVVTFVRLSASQWPARPSALKTSRCSRRTRAQLVHTTAHERRYRQEPRRSGPRPT